MCNAKPVLAIVVFLITISGAFAQPGEEEKPKTSQFKLTLKGETQDDRSREVREVLVLLYQDPTLTGRWVEVQKTVSSRKGEFKFDIDLYSRYMVQVDKGGYSTKQVTFDTDVYDEGDKKHEFAFQIIMVPDDGVQYTGPVANVFYHTKKGEFDYELDYSKEEQDEWERLEKERLEREEQMRIEAELAAQRKFEADDLKEKEANDMALKIEEAVKLGMGDKERTIQKLAEIYPKEDTLRQRKAIAMYDQLIAEREAANAASRPVDYKSLFGVAQKVQKEAEKEYEEKVAAEKEKIRIEKQELQAKKDEALRVEKERAALEMASRLAEAEKEQKAKEEKEFKDKVTAFQEAIDRGGGDKKATIAAIKNTFPKNETYKEEKALALYEEYEKLRQGGQTKASIDYHSLFATATKAEMEAKRKEEEARKEAGEVKYEEALKKIEERKAAQEAEAIKKIEDAIQQNAGSKERLIQAFEKVLPAGDKFKRQEAEAMYEQYEKDRGLPGATKYTKEQIIEKFEQGLPASEPNKRASAEEMYEQYMTNKDLLALNANDRNKAVEVAMRSIPANDPNREEKAKALVDMFQEERKLAQGGNNYASVNYKSIFDAAQRAKVKATEEARDKKEEAEAERQKRIAEHFEEQRKSLEEKVDKTDETVGTIHNSAANKELLKKQTAVKNAFEKGGGDPDATVKLLMKIFPDDTPYREEKATAMYEQNEENKKLASGGTQSFAIDYKSLFAAADRAELDQLQKAYEEDRAEEIAQQEAYRKEVQAKQEEILAANNKQAEEELAKAKEELALAQASYKTPEQLAEEEKQRKLEQAALELKQEQFADLIDRGNGEARKKNYEEAKNYYSQANELIPNESVVEEKLKEMDRLIAQAEEERVQAELAAAEKKMEEELKRQQEELERLEKEAQKEKEYQRLMANGTEALDFKKYEEARKLFAQAADLKPDSKEATEKMNEAGQLAKEEKEILAAAEKEAKQKEINAKKYDKLMAEANVALENKYLQEAKRLYTEASELMPELKEPKQKIEEADALIAAKEKREEEEAAALAALEAKKETYNKLTDAGDDLFEDGDYQGAKAKYEQAGNTWSDGKYHLVRLKDVDNKLVEIANRDAQYNDYMQQADGAVKSAFYEKAKGLYVKASQVKPDEQEPKDKIREVEEKMEEIAAKEREMERKKQQAIIEAREKNYKTFISNGDQSMAEGNYKKAIEWYGNAMDTKPEDQAARDKRSNAELQWAKEVRRADSLAQVMDEAERRKRMDDLIAKIKESELNEIQRREEFLSQVAMIYPQGLTKETINADDHTLYRYVYNDGGKVTIYEKKVWNWGGQFHFKNGDITITEELFNLGIQEFEK